MARARPLSAQHNRLNRLDHQAQPKQKAKKMNENERINYFPNSDLHDHLETAYESELSFHAEPIDWIDPEPILTPEELITSLEEGYGYDPLEDIEGDDIARLWADMSYPLPSSSDDLIGYGRDANDIALEALREYVGLYDLQAHAERVLEAEKERRRD